ncbi:MAG TPA: SGNH/GDSL hydrolase family protein [Nocardioidaceae bacterium]|nr:SGNH/GDSL hydrolase family protein [Nocardioidaceae bacterium]
MGDSYTAGPLIPITEATTGCFRSDSNYPSLLATALKVKHFTDASCSAAETRHVTEAQVTVADTKVRAQIDAVRRGTDLVTIGIGGNDFGLFGQGLVNIGEIPPDAVRTIGSRIEAVLGLVQRRAPQAKVVLVGYPQIIDPAQSCRALPFPRDVRERMASLQRRLNTVMAAAATATGAIFVDLVPVSAGHGICSKRPWVNGQDVARGGAAPYHPFGVEMRAVAREIELALGS